MKTNKLLFLFILVISIFAYSFWVKPYTYGFLWKILVSQKLPDKPIILEARLDLKKEVKIEKTLVFESYDYYELGFLISDSTRRSFRNNKKMTFEADIEIKIVCEAIILFDGKIKRPAYTILSGNNMDLFEKMILIDFPLLRGARNTKCLLSFGMIQIGSASNINFGDLYYRRSSHL